MSKGMLKIFMHCIHKTTETYITQFELWYLNSWNRQDAVKFLNFFSHLLYTYINLKKIYIFLCSKTDVILFDVAPIRISILTNYNLRNAFPLNGSKWININALYIIALFFTFNSFSNIKSFFNIGKKNSIWMHRV